MFLFRFSTLGADHSPFDINVTGCKDGDAVFEDGYEALEGCHGLTCSAGVLDRHIAPTCESATCSLWPLMPSVGGQETAAHDAIRVLPTVATLPLSFKAFPPPRLRGGSRGPGRRQHMASRMPQLYMHGGSRRNHRYSRNM